MVAIIIIICIVAIIVIWLIASFNGLVKMRNKVEEAFSTMDVYLKKRFDLIPNLVNTVKGYTEYESQTLQKLVEARNSVAKAASLDDRFQGENQVSEALRQLFALAENYPQLRASENFVNLQDQLQQVEEDIANARKYYNGCVRQNNDKVMMFPSSIVAKMFHFEKKTYFELDNTAERQNVSVEF